MSHRLTKLQVTDFRSIKGVIDVPLDAPVVLIHGPNGSGKTSLLSAIELGLTGAVASLGRFDEAYEENLVHYDARQASVSIASDHPKVAKDSAEIIVKASAVHGAPLLTQAQSRFFTERAFLAQATLGRLLEIYEETDARDAASPLTLFVKDLLGLDQLDTLIDGLKPATDKRLTKRSLPLYGDVEAEHKRLKAEVDRLTTAFDAARAACNAEYAALAETLIPFDLQATEDLASLLEALGDEDGMQRELIVLSELHREVDAALSLWRRIDSEDAAAKRSAVEAELRGHRAAQALWVKTHQPRLDAGLTAAAAHIPNLPRPSSVGWCSAHSSALDAVVEDLRRCEDALKRDKTARVQLETTRREREKSNARAARINEELSELSVDSGALATALSDLAPFIDGDKCPVCTRDFSEVSENSLHAHLTTHIARLSQTASRLQAVSAERKSVSDAITVADREIEALSARVIEDGARTELRTRRARLREAKQALDGLADQADVGDGLRWAVDAASERLTELRRDEETLAGIRRSAAEFPMRLNITPATEDEATTATLARCLAVMVQRQDELSKRAGDRRKAVEAVESVKRAHGRQAELKGELKDAKAAAKRANDALSAADKVRKAAKDLSDRAIAVRTDIVRDVFNESLNMIWKNLFIRLAPDEPFLPSFELPSPSKGPVEAKLVTRYRGEDRGGNPKAMLSAGNLNTAALTLFLSLHLSVSPMLPWLVIDDPVQSMDEIHIAQFAALLRTLSKQRGRQLIIAVHEKPLFEYLALELSPAAEGDRLITVELSKGSDGRTICDPNPIGWDPERVFQAATAV